MDSAMLVADPLQTVWDAGVGTTTEVGLTVTSKLNAVPVQELAVGVMIYRTTPGEVPVLSKVWLILARQPEAQSLNPVMVPPVGAVSTEAVQV